MSKWLVLSMAVLAFSATPASAAAPRDRDHDGLPDRWERKHRLSIGSPSARGDPDGDGLTNRRELRLRTHPRRADTDRDGLRDGAEVRRHRTNPRKRDTDGDGFGDGAEIRAGTSPRDDGSHPTQGGSNPPATPPVGTPPPETPPPETPPPVTPPLETPPLETPPPPSPTGEQFPNRASTGTPPGWMPAMTVSTDLIVDTASAVVQSIRFANGADLVVRAPGVVARGLEFDGGHAEVTGDGCSGDPLLIEDSTFGPEAGHAHTVTDEPVTQGGNYVARRVEGINRAEGYRGSSCGPVRVEDSFMFIWAADSGTEACNETHADGYQSYHARGATFVNNTIVFKNECGTSPYYAGYGYGESSCAGQERSSCPPDSTVNTGTYNVDRMLIGGGGYVYRHQTPGSVTGLRIINGSWWFGPIDNRCSVLGPWEAKIVETDAAVLRGGVPSADADFRVTSVVRDQPCDTEVVE